MRSSIALAAWTFRQQGIGLAPAYTCIHLLAVKKKKINSLILICNFEIFSWISIIISLDPPRFTCNTSSFDLSWRSDKCILKLKSKINSESLKHSRTTSLALFSDNYTYCRKIWDTLYFTLYVFRFIAQVSKVKYALLVGLRKTGERFWVEESRVGIIAQ